MFQRDSRISRYTYSSHNNRCINLRRKKKKENNWDKNSMNTHQNFHHVYSPALKSSPVERAARQQFKIPTATRRKFSHWKKKRDSSTFFSFILCTPVNGKPSGRVCPCKYFRTTGGWKGQPRLCYLPSRNASKIGLYKYPSEVSRPGGVVLLTKKSRPRVFSIWNTNIHGA